MPTKFLCSILLWLIIGMHVEAQEIQWADKLDFQYNNYGTQNWSGQQALGIPDAMPYGNPNPKAFRLNSYSTFGSLIVSFPNPQYVQQVLILENLGPGRISDIYLYDNAGKKYHVYKTFAKAIDYSFRSFCLRLERTRYKVRKIEITLDSSIQKGWCQIDAIGIADFNNLNDIKSRLQILGVHNFVVENCFTSIKEDLGANINTRYSEIKPIISPDGNTLYFSRKNYPGNVSGKFDAQDIFYSTKESSGAWSNASNIGSPLNNHYPNGVSGVSADGNTLLLINHYQISNEPENINGVSIAKRTKSGWSYPEKLNIKGFYNKNEFADYSLSSGGNVLIMAIEQDDSFGNQDLYVSFLEGENIWSKPINLGFGINTNKAEFSPFLAADDKTLYFASEGHGGFGGSDIFYTQRLDNTWQHWSPPLNLGVNVNSKGWDAYYSIPASGDYAYFVHGKGTSKSPMNIYRIALPQELRPQPVILVKGRVLDSKTSAPIEANLQLDIDDNPKKLHQASTDPATGHYNLILPVKSNYSFAVKAEGFITQNVNVIISSDQIYQEIEKDIYLETMDLNPVVKTNKIYFEEGKTTILSGSFKEVEEMIELMKSSPEFLVEISGHTDSRGSLHLKHLLSQDRAERIEEMFISAGIEKKRITTLAFGGTKPIASNDFEGSRRFNRRVEIKILR